MESGANVNLERASRNIAGVTLVPPTALEPYDLLRHEHVMLSREAVAKLSRSLSATRAEMPVQIEPASAPAKKAASEKSAEQSSGEGRCCENGKVGEEARGEKRSQGQSQAQREEG